MADPLYLLDTNILVHYIRRSAVQGQIEASYHLLTTSNPSLLSIVTVGEIHSLARQWNRQQNRIEQLEFLLTLFFQVDISSPGIIAAYTEIDNYSERSGYSMGKNDLWIAATAAVSGATLLTTDHDFDHLDTLFFKCIWIDPTV